MPKDANAPLQLKQKIKQTVKERLAKKRRRQATPENNGDYDVIIIGSGAAGMQTALLCAPLKTLLVTKAEHLISGSTAYAQGGMAVAIGSDDTPEQHTQDTLFAGAGLVDKGATDILTTRGKDAFNRLVDLDTPFDKTKDGSFCLGREAAHTVRRIVHAGGDATGRNMSEALALAVMNANHIDICYNTLLWDIKTTALKGQKMATGGLFYDPSRGWFGLRAGAIVMATGGSGQLFNRTTNPLTSTGDGMAVAYRAGAALSDIEFVQFHPTALDVKGKDGRQPLLTEALRGEGAILVNDKGERFMVDLHPDAELAPRDVVARGVWRQLQRGNRVFIDTRAAIGEKCAEKFPTVFALCQENGFDPRCDLLPIAPAAHYHMGGIDTNYDGQSTLSGLYAVGECARTGVHGANRLASNSLLECLVFAERVAQKIKDTNARALGDGTTLPLPLLPPCVQSYPLKGMIQKTMYEGMGLMRDKEGMEKTLDVIAHLRDLYDAGLHDAKTIDDHAVLKNMFLMAELMTTQALKREESRGGHYRTDFPNSDDAFKTSLTISIDDKDTPTRPYVPVKQPAINDAVYMMSAE